MPNTSLAEISRLRAEAEQELSNARAKEAACEELERQNLKLVRERDEALAQVAALNNYYRPNETLAGEIYAKARALLDRLHAAEKATAQPYCGHEAAMLEDTCTILNLKDRLQRAEASLAWAREALQEIRSYHTRHYGLAFKAGHMAEIASEALAALEQGKNDTQQGPP